MHANPEFCIQQHIEDAHPGDTVYIPPGTYNENLMIDKSLILSGEEDVFIEAAEFGSALSIFLGVSAELNNLNIRNTKGLNGGGVNNYGNLTITESAIHYSTVIHCGGLICNRGTLRLKDSILVNGKAWLGGGIYNEGHLSLENTTLLSNYAKYGGGIYNTGMTTIIGSQISKSVATITGLGLPSSQELNPTCAGGVYNSGNFSMEDSTIRFSTGLAAMEFRGVGVYNSGKFFLKSGDISYNIILYKPVSRPASSRGGGLYNLGDLVIKDGMVRSNATDRGGGVYNKGRLVLDGGVIKNNSARIGGGIYNERFSDVFLNEGAITRNTAVVRGGGIHNCARKRRLHGDTSIVYDNKPADIE